LTSEAIPQFWAAKNDTHIECARIDRTAVLCHVAVYHAGRDVPGSAYVQESMYKEGIADFEKVLVMSLASDTVRSRMCLCVGGPKARGGEGARPIERSLEGDKENARKAYQDFFALWKYRSCVDELPERQLVLRANG
jgi:hypothetical protein